MTIDVISITTSKTLEIEQLNRTDIGQAFKAQFGKETVSSFTERLLNNAIFLLGLSAYKEPGTGAQGAQILLALYDTFRRYPQKLHIEDIDSVKTGQLVCSSWWLWNVLEITSVVDAAYTYCMLKYNTCEPDNKCIYEEPILLFQQLQNLMTALQDYDIPFREDPLFGN